MPRMTRKNDYFVGIDLGGTNMQIGVVNAQNRIVGRDRRKTVAQDGYRKVLNRITAAIQTACEDADVDLNRIAAVGLAAPGAIDIPRGVVLEAPNLGWKNLPLRDLMRQHLGVPVVVDNDVNAAVWGEYQLGAGQVDRAATASASDNPLDVLGIWLGTGVGGGLIINGRLFHGEFFTAGEIGQTVLFPGGAKGRRTVEDFCSRTGISRTIRLRLPDYPRSLLQESLRESVTSSQALAVALRRGDRLAVEVVHEAAELLGIAIANWVTVLSLRVVIIGGGVAEALGAPLLKQVKDSFRRHVFPARCGKCKLLMTRLKDDAGLLGAAMLARQALAQRPWPAVSFH